MGERRALRGSWLSITVTACRRGTTRFAFGMRPDMGSLRI